MALPTASGSASDPNDSHAGVGFDPTPGVTTSPDADLTQAFRDIERGEQTALVLESNLTSLERKLDDFLATFEESEQQKTKTADGERNRVS